MQRYCRGGGEGVGMVPRAPPPVVPDDDDD
jgi:hypothetical protein